MMLEEERFRAQRRLALSDHALCPALAVVLLSPLSPLLSSPGAVAS